MYSGADAIKRYSDGTLALDFIDTEANELICRRSGVLTIDEAQWTSERREETINKAVQKILKNFPPDPGK